MKSFSRLMILGGAVLLAGWLAVPANLMAQAAEKAATPEQIAFFEKNIRPVLVKECYSCHAATAKKIRGGLKLDTRAGMRAGGETGPAVVPGDATRSLIIKAARARPRQAKDAAEEEARRRGDRQLQEVDRDGRPRPAPTAPSRS